MNKHEDETALEYSKESEKEKKVDDICNHDFMYGGDGGSAYRQCKLCEDIERLVEM